MMRPLSRQPFVLMIALTLLSIVMATGAFAQPQSTGISYYYDALDQSIVRPLTRSFDPANLVRKLTGNHREAANVDANDQVRLPSTWWQPRLGLREVSVEQMLRGPGPGSGPAPGKWQVVRAKTQGVSPGFQIVDSEGTRFAIKFDPPGYPELATGAEVVTTYFYWAAGYNVPDNAIAFFHRDDLEVAKGARYTDELGNKKPITSEFLDKILERAHPNADGSYRCVTSRFLSGKPLGEWKYDGRRKDDPEDLIPHEHRREIRGMWSINAWTNHVDCSARNTGDFWVTDGGRSFVRHYLIDFGACLGSASIKPHGPRAGHEYLLDFGAAAGNLVTLGLRTKKWERAVDPDMPSIGHIESKTFRADAWRSYLPNPAFDERTERDVRWGARIVGAFTDAHIRAAVEKAAYSDPRAAEYLVRTMIERRDKIVAAWVAGSQAAGPER